MTTELTDLIFHKMVKINQSQPNVDMLEPSYQFPENLITIIQSSDHDEIVDLKQRLPKVINEDLRSEHYQLTLASHITKRENLNKQWSKYSKRYNYLYYQVATERDIALTFFLSSALLGTIAFLWIPEKLTISTYSDIDFRYLPGFILFFCSIGSAIRQYSLKKQIPAVKKMTEKIIEKYDQICFNDSQEISAKLFESISIGDDDTASNVNNKSN